VLIVKSIFGEYCQNFVDLKILIEESVGIAVLLFIKDPSSKQFTSREGKQALVIYFFSWCHITLDLSQAVLIV
jgi:hypothetical protein